MKKFDFKNRTVLITGASIGIGKSFAQELAKRGANLILVARSTDKLSVLCQELSAQGIQAESISCDLSELGSAKIIYDEVKKRGLKIDVLINNAGFGKHGNFTKIAPDDLQQMILLNVLTLTELSRYFLPEIEASQGGLINIASTAGFQPLSYLSAYAASKAYVISFGEALWGEYQNRGVRILTICPGATETGFQKRAGDSLPHVTAPATPEAVVQVGLDAFDRGKATIVEGLKNYLLTLISRFTTRQFAIRTAEKMMRSRI